MLRVAVPNKGALSEAAVGMLREAGYRQRRDSRELVLPDHENGVEFFFLRPRDIAVYVGAGTLDVGITGRDLLLDSGADAREVVALGFGESTFRFAAQAGQRRRRSPTSRAGGSPPATPGWSSAASASTASRRDVVRLDGAVETAVRLGRGRRHRGRRRDGHHAPQRRPRGVRRAHPALGGRARAARRRGRRPGGRRPRAAPAGRARGPAVRAHGLRRPGRAGRAGVRDHAGARVADRLAAAGPGLGRRPGDGAARAHQPGHGRARTRWAPGRSS